jgi:hypothetical protein
VHLSLVTLPLEAMTLVHLSLLSCNLTFGGYESGALVSFNLLEAMTLDCYFALVCLVS